MEIFEEVFGIILALTPSDNLPHRGVSAFAIEAPAYVSSACDRLVASLADTERIFLPTLHGTFGEDEGCIHRVLAVHRLKSIIVQVHLTNETMRRRRRSQRGEGEMLTHMSIAELNAGLEAHDSLVLDAVRNRTAEVLAKQRELGTPNTRWILGVGLEDNYTDRAAEVMVNTVREVWPYEVSRNPLKGSYRAGADFIESHSTARRKGFAPPCLANEDGRLNSTKASEKFLKTYGDCLAVALWDKDHQGANPGGSFKLPRLRTFKFTNADMKKYKRILSRW